MNEVYQKILESIPMPDMKKNNAMPKRLGMYNGAVSKRLGMYNTQNKKRLGVYN